MAHDEEMLVTWNEFNRYSKVIFPFSVPEEINLNLESSGEKREGNQNPGPS